MTVRRGIFLVGVVVLCAWVLVPIWLIAANAVGGQPLIAAWPKPFWPASASFATLWTFLAIEGVAKALGVPVSELG